MTLLFPKSVAIDGQNGGVQPATGRYAKRLSDLAGIFSDQGAYADALAGGNDPIVYEVVEHRQDGNDIFFGTTTMQPGKVGSEYFMTRGHFHADPTMGEIYYTQSGAGVLLLESRDGACASVAMTPGSCAVIPPDWAHRSVNTGRVPLVFLWVCNTAAGHDYGVIATKGMRQMILEEAGAARIRANPRHA